MTTQHQQQSKQHIKQRSGHANTMPTNKAPPKKPDHPHSPRTTLFRGLSCLPLTYRKSSQ